MAPGDAQDGAVGGAEGRAARGVGEAARGADEAVQVVEEELEEAQGAQGNGAAQGDAVDGQQLLQVPEEREGVGEGDGEEGAGAGQHQASGPHDQLVRVAVVERDLGADHPADHGAQRARREIAIA